VAKTVTFDVLAVAHGVGFDELGNKIKGIARDSKVHVSSLVAGLTAVAPAMIPIGVAAAGLSVGLGALGAAGLLAFLGIKEQMKAGTLQGQQLGQQITAMNTNFAGLKAVSATAIGPGLTQGLRALNQITPFVSMAMETLSTQLGQIASHLGPALAALFIRLMPLFTLAGNQLVRLSAGFERWATSGTGVTKFVDYVQKNLPTVERVLGQLALAIGRLVQGLGPLGGVSFSTIGVLAKLINLIPVPLLKSLAPIIAGIILATKAWEIAMTVLNLVMEANPFVLIATLIIGVGLALVEAYKHSQTFRDVVKAVFKDIELAALYLARFFIQYLLIPVLDVYSAIIHGAADAFGWVPGIGGKLKTARRAFDDFRKGVDTALHGINVQIDTLQAGRALAHVHDMIDKLQSKQITLTTYIQQVILPTLGTPSVTHDSHRAMGGPVYAGSSYIVGERGPELFVPSQSGTIIPNSRSGGANVVININGVTGSPGSDRAIAAALSRVVGKDVIAILRAS
jgi:hypothetical protein